MILKHLLAVGFLVAAWSVELTAGVSFSPYVSIRSTKTINPQKTKKTEASTEKETIKQHREAGIKAGLKFWSLFQFQVGVGQSTLKTTEKISEVKDDYGKLDMQKELSIPEGGDAEAEVKLTETQRIARASLIIDPGFWIFICRAKVGATARQRTIAKEDESGTSTTEFKATYGLHSGAGLGVRFSPSFYAIAEYGFEHYAFPPDLEPFERQASIGFNITI
jgi:hypothetical protein